MSTKLLHRTKADLLEDLAEMTGRAHEAEHHVELLHDEIKERGGQIDELKKRIEADTKDARLKKFSFANVVLRVAKHLRDCAETGVFDTDRHDSIGVVASAVILGDFTADYGKVNYCGIFGHPWQAYNWCRPMAGSASSSYVVITLLKSGEIVVEDYFDDAQKPRGQRLRFSTLN